MEGWLLHEDQHVRITLSNHPIIGFFEYNIRFKPDTPVRPVAIRLQQVLRYVLHTLSNLSQSYNYFFYNLEDGYDYIKVVARYVNDSSLRGLQNSSNLRRRTSCKNHSRHCAVLPRFKIVLLIHIVSK